MAMRIVSWGGNEHIVSPNPLKSPSIVSVDSILQDKPDTFPAVQGTPQAAQSRTMNMASQVMGPSRTRTWMSTSTYQGADAADGSFVRHPKYFFKDGNVAFLVDNTLYCVHRYFFSRDSIYFSTRFTQLNIRDHEALPTIISLGDIECKDFDAFLSVLYPENFEENYLCYEEWKSVLHLSTRWSFSSIRKLALSSIEPPTPYDRLILARTYSVHDWVVPALSALCERTTPLTLSEAHQMHIEDVILISSVREHIRGGTIQVDAAEIPLLVEAEQLIALGHRTPLPCSRESEDDTPMASAWHSRSRPEKSEAEARAKAQEATRLHLDAEAKERAGAEERALQEAEYARLEAEEKERLEAQKARKAEEEKVRPEAEKAPKEEKERARLEAEKALRAEEEKSRLEAEKSRKDEEKWVRLEAQKACKDEEENAHLEAEKECKDAQKARLAAEKIRKDAEKALAKKAKKEAAAAAKKREADAKAAKEKLEAEAKADEARIKAKEDADNKAKTEEEAEAKEAADREAAKAAEDAKATVDSEAEAKAIEDAKAIADAEARSAAEKAEQEAATRAGATKADAAVEEVKGKQRGRAEKPKETELRRAREAAEQVARQRAADRAQKAARLAPGSPAPSPISSRSSGEGWFSKLSQATAASGQSDKPRSPRGPATTDSPDLFSRLQIRHIPSPSAEPGPRNSSAMRQSTSNLFPDTLSPPPATSGSATRSSVESENPKI